MRQPVDAVSQLNMDSTEKKTTYKKVALMGVPFSCCSFEEILQAMDKKIHCREQGYISITNTESLYHGLRIPGHFNYLVNANFSCCDGVGVVIAAKMLGLSIPRLHGPDLLLECCRFGVNHNWRHFFYGGKEGVPQLLAANLEKKIPGIQIAGTYSPPFRPLTKEEDEEVISMINAAKPDILWVGLGLLKQEKWIEDHLGKVMAPWMIGVGAAFDFYAGTIKRAPLFFRKIGMEWLYRLTFEPRMFKRNVYSFLLLVDVARAKIFARGEGRQTIG